jgi:uncharacterized protein
MAFEGKTYSLFDEDEASAAYYATIRQLADDFLQSCPDAKKLLALIQKGGEGVLQRHIKIRSQDRQMLSHIRKTLKGSLSIYTKNVEQHLKTLSAAKRLDDTLATKEEQYHLYMLEIEFVNRIYREEFKKSEYKFALIAHCLRDFRPECRAEQCAVEAVCQGCTDECLVHLGSALLRKYRIEPYISVRMDQDKLFKQLKREHPSIGALGIACVPELAIGMRLCIRLGIAPIGIPLDANRCARWLREAQETSFNFRQLEDLLESP